MTNDAERRSDDGGDGVCEYCLAAADEEDDEEDDDDERRGRFEGFSGVDSLDAELQNRKKKYIVFRELSETTYTSQPATKGLATRRCHRHLHHEPRSAQRASNNYCIKRCIFRTGGEVTRLSELGCSVVYHTYT